MTRLNFDNYTAVYLQTVDSSLRGSGWLISVQISKENYIRNEFHKLGNSYSSREWYLTPEVGLENRAVHGS